LSLRRRSYYKYYRKLNFNQIKFEANEDLIHYIGAEVDQAFIKSSIENASFNTPAEAKENKMWFHFITWDFHHLVPDTLSKAGYTNVHIVPEQAVPNGDFPTNLKSEEPSLSNGISFS
jgi:hypothetical protein